MYTSTFCTLKFFNHPITHPPFIAPNTTLNKQMFTVLIIINVSLSVTIRNINDEVATEKKSVMNVGA